MTFRSLPTLFVSVYDSNVDQNKISNKPLSVEEGEPMEFSKNSNRHKFDGQSSKDLKSSALPDMLAILVLCEGNAWQHGQYMPPWTTAFLRIYRCLRGQCDSNHFLPRGMQAAKLPEWEAQGAEATCNQALPPTELQCMSHRKHRHGDIIQNMHMILI